MAHFTPTDCGHETTTKEIYKLIWNKPSVLEQIKMAQVWKHPPSVFLSCCHFLTTVTQTPRANFVVLSSIFSFSLNISANFVHNIPPCSIFFHLDSHLTSHQYTKNQNCSAKMSFAWVSFCNLKSEYFQGRPH